MNELISLPGVLEAVKRGLCRPSDASAFGVELVTDLKNGIRHRVHWLRGRKLFTVSAGFMDGRFSSTITFHEDPTP